MRITAQPVARCIHLGFVAANCYQQEVDSADFGELDAAVTAHREWLTRRNEFTLGSFTAEPANDAVSETAETAATTER